MAKATTISAAQLSSAAHAAAKTAVTTAKLGHVTIDPGIIVDPHWIIGIVIRNPVLNNLPQYLQVAEHITEQVNKTALNPQPEPPGAHAQINPQPLPPVASASIYHYDHVIICGYRPALELPKTIAQ